MNKRYAVFASYNKKGAVEKYVLYYLKELNKIVDGIVFIADNEAPNKEIKKLKNLVIHKEFKKHGEYDFGSYKRGFNYLKENGFLDNADEIIFANDSVFGPLMPLEKLILKYNEDNKPDLYGITINNRGINASFENTFFPHVQSYFFIVSKKFFTNNTFNNFIESIKKEEIKEKVILNYEIGLTKLANENGFSIGSYFGKGFDDNATLFGKDALKTIEEGFFCKKNAGDFLGKKEVIKILHKRKYPCTPSILKEVVQSIFGIKNKNAHKIITICGIKFKIKRNHPPKLLVAVHVFYNEQVDYIISKLKNISGINYDLFVTYAEKNKETINKFKNFCPNAIFFKTSNTGYDIWPFICILNQVELKDYDYILKLHTKSKNKYGSYEWRDDLFDSLLLNKQTFKRALKMTEKHGMTGAKNRLDFMLTRWPENRELFREVCKNLNISNEKTTFVAGTIFLVKSKYMQMIKDFNLKEEDFAKYKADESYSSGTLAHVVERLLGAAVTRQGGRIFPLQNKKSTKKEFIRKIFSIQNKNTEKILTILGISFNFPRYKYKIKGIQNQLMHYEGGYIKKDVEGLEIEINGSGNLIKISNSAVFSNCRITINSDSVNIAIKPQAVLNNIEIAATADGQLITVEENTKISGKIFDCDKIDEECILE